MSRHVLFRVLLSLLLLASQHMATAHVLSHWIGARERPAQLQVQTPSADDSSSAVKLDQSCHQCLACAHLGGPLPTPHFYFPLPACVSSPVLGVDVAAAHARTILAFHSRGPPQA